MNRRTFLAAATAVVAPNLRHAALPHAMIDEDIVIHFDPTIPSYRTMRITIQNTLGNYTIFELSSPQLAAIVAGKLIPLNELTTVQNSPISPAFSTLKPPDGTQSLKVPIYPILDT